jgi:outer membrane immunogenic protein
MSKMLLAPAAVVALTMAGPAFAADLPSPGAAPIVLEQPFSWTSCYAGGHVGGGWGNKDLTDPVQLVQDSNSFFGAGATTGVTTARTTPSGVLIGGQIGCDYQFASTWVVGIEGAASGSTMKGSTSALLPLSPGDSALVTAKTNFIPSVTGRLGYAIDRVMLYARGGVAWAGDQYSVTGVVTGVGGFNFQGLETRTGWTAGGGLEWAFSRHWSTFVEYDVYQFGRGAVLMNDPNNGFGSVSVKQSFQVVKVGLNFHMWSSQ